VDDFQNESNRPALWALHFILPISGEMAI